MADRRSPERAAPGEGAELVEHARALLADDWHIADEGGRFRRARREGPAELVRVDEIEVRALAGTAGPAGPRFRRAASGPDRSAAGRVAASFERAHALFDDPAWVRGTPGRRRRLQIAGVAVPVLLVAGLVTAALTGSDAPPALEAPKGFATAPATAPPLAPPPRTTALIATGLPGGLREALPAPVRSVGGATALGSVCAGESAAAVVDVTTPRPCALATAGVATVGATVLLAPGGGCLPVKAARVAAVNGAGSAGGAPAVPVAVRPAGGGPCIAPDAASLRSGRFPLTRRAAVLVRPADRGSARTRELVVALRAEVASAPVAQVVVPRLRRG